MKKTLKNKKYNKELDLKVL